MKMREVGGKFSRQTPEEIRGGRKKFALCRSFIQEPYRPWRASAQCECRDRIWEDERMRGGCATRWSWHSCRLRPSCLCEEDSLVGCRGGGILWTRGKLVPRPQARESWIGDIPGEGCGEPCSEAAKILFVCSGYAAFGQVSGDLRHLPAFRVRA